MAGDDRRAIFATGAISRHLQLKEDPRSSTANMISQGS
jgi:hypothetical protein